MKNFLIKSVLTVFIIGGLFSLMSYTSAKAASVTSGDSTLNVALKSPKSSTLLLTSTFSSTQLASTAKSSSDYVALYFVQTTEFSSRGWMQIGSASLSASTGEENMTSTVSYDPTWTGRETFKVELLQNQNGAGVVLNSATTVFNVLKDPSGFPSSEINYQRPMNQVGKWLVRGLLTLVALVWILMFGVLGFVVNRVSKNGKVALND